MIIFTLILSIISFVGLIAMTAVVSKNLYDLDQARIEHKYSLKSLDTSVGDLKKDRDILKFELRNGINKIDIQPLFDIYGYFNSYEISYVLAGQINKVRINQPFSDNRHITRYKDTECEAIIKIGDVWYKLDKSKQTIIDIPEPAEFAEKEEVTE